jgi:pimeloyl-ACP methyl ester carboxylesterase
MELKFIDIQGLRVRYLATNGKSEIPLIILHGWGSSIDSWRDVASALAEYDIRVLIPDLPGFGQTSEPPISWGTNEYATFIQKFARKLGIQNFDLAGHSFGGQIAITYATRYPHDTRKLILIAAARIMTRRKLRVRLFLGVTKIGNLIFVIPPFVLLRPLMRRIWYMITGERDYYRASAGMRTIFKNVSKNVSSHLAMIQSPTLILWGENDEATPLADALIIHKKIPNSKLHIFPGEGHALNFKKPREIAQQIADFRKEL